MAKLKPLLLQIKTKLDKTTNITRENLTGVRVVRAFNKQNYETEKFKNSNYDLITTIDSLALLIANDLYFPVPVSYALLCYRAFRYSH